MRYFFPLLLFLWAAMSFAQPIKSMLGLMGTANVDESSHISPVPSDLYTEVEYLKPENKDQYITLYESVYLPKLEFEIQVQNNYTGAGGGYVLLADHGGVRDGGIQHAAYTKIRFTGSSNVDIAGFSSNGQIVIISYLDGIASLTPNGAQMEWSWVARSSRLTLFGIAKNSLICSIYHARIWKDKELTYDLYPCIRVSDDKPGFFNAVDGSFLTNTGSGEFVVGAVK